MRSTEADRESAAIIAPTSGPFGRDNPRWRPVSALTY